MTTMIFNIRAPSTFAITYCLLVVPPLSDHRPRPAPSQAAAHSPRPRPSLHGPLPSPVQQRQWRPSPVLPASNDEHGNTEGQQLHQREPPATSSLGFRSVGILHVKILRAKQLRKKDLLGAFDTYVIPM
nr:synaptotagmin-1-like [Ipomoea batatas]